MPAPPRKPPGGATRLDRPWVPGDSIPLPDAVHRDGESAWALWQEVNQQEERRFAPTAPMSGPATLPPDQRPWAPTEPPARAGALPLPVPRRRAEPVFTLDSALLLARKNNRVCPRPEHWSAFHALLPARKTLRGSLPPPAPVLGGAWAVTPPLTKRLTFREQLEWAEREGVLEQAIGFLVALQEDDWFHMGDD